MKIALSVLGGAILLLLGAFVLWSPQGQSAPVGSAQHDEDARPVTLNDRRVVANGTYVVRPESSEVVWSGKKPLIEGYINSGSFDVKAGTIEVAETSASGNFTIDIDTLTVSTTAKKPGQETALEGHLKGERWFNTTQFPTATFAIATVTPRTDSATTFIYDVTGDLTLKGQTHPLTFPATIYQDASGLVHAEASLEFDRTVWGITAGSKNFFDNLADNAVDEMVALSFELIAEKLE